MLIVRGHRGTGSSDEWTKKVKIFGCTTIAVLPHKESIACILPRRQFDEAGIGHFSLQPVEGMRAIRKTKGP